MALGWRVRTPWTTPANGGSHGAASSRNLSFRCGQRPSIHRLQQCRRPKGPRASDAPVAPTPGPKPRRGTPRQQRITHGGWCRARGASTHQTRKGIHQAGKVTTADGLTKSRASSGRCGGETCAHLLHIPSDHRWGDATRAIVPCPERN